MMDFKKIVIGLIIGLLIGTGMGYGLYSPQISRLQTQIDPARVTSSPVIRTWCTAGS
jgi:hypothetical protein